MGVSIIDGFERGLLLSMVLKGVPPFVENGLEKAVSLWIGKGLTVFVDF